MRVGILTVRASAGEEGGAERFFDGLHRALVEHGLDAELVAIPSDESTFGAIEETYLRCYDFDASGYDAVISTKAPTYLVRHRNHVCYLVHTVRVFYDMFESAFPHGDDEALRQRALIHRLDTLAFKAPRTRKVFAIGNEVANRLRQDNGIEAVVMHPPVGLDLLHRGPLGDYVFLPGRLHRWKRVDLVIDAMRLVRRPLRLVIAGSGEDAPGLRTRASGDDRIVFTGRVSDAELADLYANALCVAFVPMREDYGYVTVEAFRCGKPVITCRDSGEAAFLVEHECSGLVVTANPQSLADAFERLDRDREFARLLGDAGYAREQSIRWTNVVPELTRAFARP